jgi:mono/diheme cytochrome c family protein
MVMRTIFSVLTLVALSAGASFAGDAKAGQASYDKSCKSCHGPDGAANPAVAKMMKVEMRSLNSPEVQTLSDADLKTVITTGKGKMPAVKSVSGPAADDVIAYVRSFKK